MHNEPRRAGLIFQMIVAGAVAAGAAGPAAAQSSGVLVPGEETGTSTLDTTDEQGSLVQGSLVEARTGTLHRDCERFSHSASGDKYDLEAWCRVDDETNNLAETSTDLAAKIGVGTDGRLAWGGSLFHRKCESIGLLHHVHGVQLTAQCEIADCVYQEGECIRNLRRGSELWLENYYEVDASGRIVVKE